jgi:excisionase family DNA binding protein
VEFLTVEEFADRLGISTKTAYSLVHRGLPTLCVGSHFRIPFSEAVDWLRSEEEEVEQNVGEDEGESEEGEGEEESDFEGEEEDEVE